jgi:hypothetical protein
MGNDIELDGKLELRVTEIFRSAGAYYQLGKACAQSRDRIILLHGDNEG